MNKNALLVLALLACVAMSCALDDGPELAQQAHDDYCARVAAGTHSDYEESCP